MVSHKENWELADRFDYSGVAGDLDPGEQFWTRTGDKSLTRFSLKEDGEIELEHKSKELQNTTHIVLCQHWVSL